MKINEASLPVFDGSRGNVQYNAWATQVSVSLSGASASDALKPWPAMPNVSNADKEVILLSRRKAEDTARYIIFTCLSPTQRTSYNMTLTSVPHIIWSKIRDKHGVVSAAQSQRLQVVYNKATIDDDEDVEHYIGRLGEMIQNLRSAGVITKPESFLAKIIGDLQSVTYYQLPLAVFLGRDQSTQDIDTFASYMLTYEITNPRPSRLSNSSSSRALSAVNKGKPSSQPSGSIGMICSFCKKTGHKIDKCWTKYPEQRKDLPPRGQYKRGRLTQAKAARVRDAFDSDSPMAFTAGVVTSASNSLRSSVILDTGCTQHMTPDFSSLVNFKPLAEAITVYWGNSTGDEAQGTGDLAFSSTVDGVTRCGYFSDVLYVPHLGKTTLISLSQLSKKGGRMHPCEDGSYIVKKTNGPDSFRCKEENGLYRADIKLLGSGKIPGKIVSFNYPAATDGGAAEFYGPFQRPVPDGPLGESEGEDDVYEPGGDDEDIITSDGRPTTKADLWHYRFGHLSSPIVKDALKPAEIAVGVPTFCDICPKGKMARPSFKTREANATVPLQIVHTDVCGPFPDSMAHKKYFVSYTDDYTRMASVYFLEGKTAIEVLATFEHYWNMCTTLHGSKIKALQSDNGGEFVNEIMNKFCNSKGIEKRLSSAYSPQSNGVAERQNRTFINIARCLLFSARLQDEFWAEAVATACYLRNLITTSTSTGDFVPWKRWFGTDPPVKSLRVWGCPVYSKIIKPGQQKLDPRTREGIFVGYTQSKDLYRVFVPSTKKIFLSRDIIFHEDSVIHHDLHTDTRRQQHRVVLDLFDSSEDDLPPPRLVNILPRPPPREYVPTTLNFATEENEPVTELRIMRDNIGPVAPVRRTTTDSNQYRQRVRLPLIASEQTEYSTEGQGTSTQFERGPVETTVYKRPIRTEKRVSCVLPVPECILRYEQKKAAEALGRISGESSSTAPKPKVFTRKPAPSSIGIRTQPLPGSRTANLAQTDSYKISIPNTVAQAMASEQIREWQDALYLELKNIESHHTWDLVPLPSGSKAIPCRWVFAVKYQTDGSVKEYKARLVVKGFHQRQGVDFEEVESPVATLDTVRCLTAIAAANSWVIRHMDVSGAFLNGDLSEDLYITQPPGFVDQHKPTHVCKLKKALYGLKQASLAWYITLTKFLTSVNFRASSADRCLFIRDIEGSPYIAIIVYVDDILAVSAEVSTIEKFFYTLNASFKSKYLGMPDLFLGIRFRQLPGVILLDQQHYILDLLDRFSVPMTAQKTPADRGQIRDIDTESAPCDPSLFRSIVGALLWICRCTRPDIAFVVGWLGRNNQVPTKAHLSVANNTMAYLINTSDLCLQYTVGDSELMGYTDSDFAEDPTRKSTGGFVFYLRQSDSPISWNSRLQGLVSRSVTEAEYIACAQGCLEATWLTALFKHFHFDFTCTPIFVDNAAARDLLELHSVRQRTKHIDIIYHYCRERNSTHHVNILPIAGVDNPADIFTKPFAPSAFITARARLNLVSAN